MGSDHADDVADFVGFRHAFHGDVIDGFLQHGCRSCGHGVFASILAQLAHGPYTDGVNGFAGIHALVDDVVDGDFEGGKL